MGLRAHGAPQGLENDGGQPEGDGRGVRHRPRLHPLGAGSLKVERVIDFTQFEDPLFCKTEFGLSDEDLAAEFGGPADGDWYGHGSWIGGNIAAALDRQGVNGIAPKVGLVSLKIAQWCGFGLRLQHHQLLLMAADLGIDVVNISFGGYLDRSDPEQELIYRAFVDAVRYARSKGTADRGQRGQRERPDRRRRPGAVARHAHHTGRRGCSTPLACTRCRAGRSRAS